MKLGKLPLAAALTPLTDKRQLALLQARFRAWWEGGEYDAAAAEAAVDAALAADKTSPDNPDTELFSDPGATAAPLVEAPPRFQALEALWGEGRAFPGDAASDASLTARINLPATGVLGVFGPGLDAPIRSLADAHPGEIRVYEWRVEALALLRARVQAAGLAHRVTVEKVDLDTVQLPPDSFDGLISFDDFTYCDNPPRFAVQLARALKEPAMAVLEFYAGQAGPHLSPAFAAAFAEPQTKLIDALRSQMREAGLRIEEEEDLTALHKEMAREGLKRAAARMAEDAPLPPLALQEMAWEAQSWGARLKLLTQERLFRVRLLLARR
jgi:hypothetical protein